MEDIEEFRWRHDVSTIELKQAEDEGFYKLHDRFVLYREYENWNPICSFSDFEMIILPETLAEDIVYLKELNGLL